MVILREALFVMYALACAMAEVLSSDWMSGQVSKLSLAFRLL